MTPTDKIIDGTKIAELFAKAVVNDIEIVRQKVEAEYPNIPIRRPCIVSFCNQEDQSSVKYTKLQSAKAEELGIDFKIVYITPESTLSEIIDLIQRFNANGNIDGIMVQLPISAHLQKSTEQIISTIAPYKDVDGLTLAGQAIFRPATVEAIFQILQTENTDLTNKVVAVVGSEGVIGKSLVAELSELSPKEVIRIDTKLSGTSIDQDLKTSDIVFSCIPGQSLIRADDLKSGVILYDIGLGNFDPSAYAVASRYTPSRGGIGPNTVVALMRNVVKAYDKHIKQAYGLT